MSVFAYARRGARVGVCVLALGAVEATAQQVSDVGDESVTQGAAPGAAEPILENEAVKPEPAPTGADAAPAANTSTLPELVVDGTQKKNKKKTVKAKDAAADSITTSEAQATAEPAQPGVTLGTTAAADTGTTTFDANNVKLRTDGSGDANTFLRNLPNVQYQNQNSADPGAGSQKAIDSKPALMSISGGRTYENNFILNGVSISSITGSAERRTELNDTSESAGIGIMRGLSPQTIYVPTEFIGQATIIDSNASAEYGQFQGGVVIYDLAGPPTDGYHSSVSFSRDTSEFSNYILATPDGTNPRNRKPPAYEKTTLSASVGAPITNDFAFVVQVSRKEAESSKQRHFYVGDDFIAETSENIFLRFAATARTEIGKFTLDSSSTDYFQHWHNYLSSNYYLDVNTQGTSTQLKYDGKLPGLNVDAIGLGGAKLTARAFYNTTETQNNSGAAYTMLGYKQSLDPAGAGSTEVYHTSRDDCRGVEDPATYSLPAPFRWGIFCYAGGAGNSLQGQTDYGVQAALNGDVLLGSFKVGAELKRYRGERARLDELRAGLGDIVIGTDPNGNLVASDEGAGGAPVAVPTGGEFICDGDDPLCTPTQFSNAFYIYPAYATAATLNAFHTYVEIDQTWKWFNVRAGGRLDYDDYFKNINIAPRLAGTIKPFEGLSFTAGYNRYYLGEALYYALRDKQAEGANYYRSYNADGTLTDYAPKNAAEYRYKVAGLNTPYQDEYTGVVRITDPLFGGQWRGKYLERYGREQFATTSCGKLCFTVSNDGETFYRSASVEYTKEWYGLRTPFYLDAAAITGNVTWSEQKTAHDTYLVNSDLNGDGTLENRIYYNGNSYLPEELRAITGNLDIPVRFGATLATVWFDDFLRLNLSAGINLGYEGVYDTDTNRSIIVDGVRISHDVYADRKFGATLDLDVSGQINVTEQAAIEFSINNITNSAQNTITTENAPWVLGRSYWLGSALRF